jgi:hypothetical protein
VPPSPLVLGAQTSQKHTAKGPQPFASFTKKRLRKGPVPPDPAPPAGGTRSANQALLAAKLGLISNTVFDM